MSGARSRRAPARRRWLGGAAMSMASLALGGIGALPRALRAANAARTPVPTSVPTPVPNRIVVLNWELTETLLALGRAPIGIPLPDWYTATIVTPPLPPRVADVGLLYQPNFDVLRDLAPDLLIVTPEHAGLLAPLHRIAPTLTLGAYMNAAQPYDALQAETLAMAHALDAQPRAHALIADTARALDAVSARLRGSAPRTVIVADAIDERHFRVYAKGSLFDAVLARLGVINAVNPREASAAQARWTANAMGSAVVPLQRLTDVAHADMLLVGPLHDETRAALGASPLWRALPAARERRVAVLPVIAPYGGLLSMRRFAVAVEAALGAIANAGGGLG
ncbi:ABC transporter substrate-binding protein [Paraburkholderia acidisoli]|uniref:ABC transporter substrate-binding protein n=1 Tax=Paraburkholderia acidisoli TaxID=2571748 RepID=A0A7Z2GM22_9BURK|nr:ABC transporter substrate-binding protein [Paraburkholderia acidisoli]QGZ64306.1 ABC transporter substrate-binding protein [Paraburkholderia acidisoli]